MQPIPAHPDGPYERGAVIQWLRDVDRALDSWDPISIASLISVAASYLARPRPNPSPAQSTAPAA
jgi:hypothetical protein